MFTIFLFQEKPENPPSLASTVYVPEEYSFCDDLKDLLKNSNFVVLSIVISLINGVYMSFGATINTQLAPYSFTDTHSSIGGAAYIVTGIVGSFFITRYVDNTKKYKRVILILTWGATLSAICLNVTLRW